MAGFFSTQQSTSIPQPGLMENSLYEQLFGLAGQQAASLGSQNALQQALLNPHQSLQILNSESPYGPGGATEMAMRKQFGNAFMDRFNAGGGTGKGMTAEEFASYNKASRAFAHSDLRDIDSPDLRMKLQQMIAQNQAAQQGQAQQLDRMQNPYGLTEQEQAGINQVYDNQRAQAMYNMRQGVQDMATSRGLNVYDAPVSNELARQLGLMESNLGAAQAGDLLNRGETNRNYGLNLVAQNANLGQMGFNNSMALNQMTPGANTALLQPLLQQRMAQTTTTGTPSMFDTIMRGVGAVGGMAMGAGGFMSGLGAMGGAAGGSAGGANLGLSSYLASGQGAGRPFTGLSGSYGG